MGKTIDFSKYIKGITAEFARKKTDYAIKLEAKEMIGKIDDKVNWWASHGFSNCSIQANIHNKHFYKVTEYLDTKGFKYEVVKAGNKGYIEIKW